MRSAWPGARWVFGLSLFAAMVLFFWSCGVFDRHQTGATIGPAVFFSAAIAYGVPIFGYISERTERALAELAPVLDAEPAQIGQWYDRVRHKSLRWLVIVLTLGSVSGVVHNVVLAGTPALVLSSENSPAQVALMVGTELVWIVLTVVVAGLLDHARVVWRAARHCRVNLLDTGPLRPFATVAVSSTLAIIGIQAAFPIMSFDGGLEPVTYTPGLVATGVPMLLLAALPIWPVHRRIATARRAALAAVNAALAARPAPNPADPASLSATLPLLGYRRELEGLSEWPFDVGVMTRLGLYLIIPPLTWVGAALIEHLVDTFF